MKRRQHAVFHNWKIKLGALLAAGLIWSLIKHHITPGPAAIPAPTAEASGL